MENVSTLISKYSIVVNYHKCIRSHVIRNHIDSKFLFLFNPMKVKVINLIPSEVTNSKFVFLLNLVKMNFTYDIFKIPDITTSSHFDDVPRMF